LSREKTHGELLDELSARLKKHLTVPDPPSFVDHPLTRSAQARLRAGQRSAYGFITDMRIIEALEVVMMGVDPRGRLSERKVDSLRSAIVFAGAAADATLKELTRSTLPSVIEVNAQAATAFERFATDHFDSGAGLVTAAELARAVLHPEGTRKHLLTLYLEKLSGKSLQSADQVEKICLALGIEQKVFRSRLKEGGLVDTMFRARNEIVHRLDLVEPGAGTGKARRNSRKIKQTETWLKEILTLCQDIVNKVAASLPQPG
jgi:hypothetical protein